jgi:Zn finger protein HypA/HybF involved in hydrogenase expression
MQNLPSSTDEYWDDAHVEIINKAELKSRQKDCEHFFEKKNNTAQCKNCGIGFFIKIDDKIENGHLYYKDELII